MGMRGRVESEGSRWDSGACVLMCMRKLNLCGDAPFGLQACARIIGSHKETKDHERSTFACPLVANPTLEARVAGKAPTEYPS